MVRSHESGPFTPSRYYSLLIAGWFIAGWFKVWPDVIIDYWRPVWDDIIAVQDMVSKLSCKE